MGDPFMASTQYNDLIGGAAFDGHDSPPLFILAKKLDMPEGYWPVGFELSELAPAKKQLMRFCTHSGFWGTNPVEMETMSRDPLGLPYMHMETNQNMQRDK